MDTDKAPTEITGHRRPDAPREATAEEIKWCNRMRRLMKEKPKTITLFCNGNMHVLCSYAVNTQVKKGGGMPQPIRGVSTLGPADGGDF